ncbi:hypothetical protein A2686_05380 [Candidatus Woesebacteria bacterium RIFCSPHIGHO2_01_FULL_38_10]|uniref:Uncharacterized protein n=1 Tax=Candidatus Woesebacteria bacterium RIFCSPLOWO2_01_FULL_39_10b TaxID=1802517 RepID=A0A1F8B924_9BACT|nr:MAG: hypothetical protein A2686_05380 [Candidatus Woesebacteria bacterium RIFCSPHIGHO2_01_FULL_38_10]OGM59905.1 MAG: hypothetical protein A2892_02905 [Candidatus Woesebacteria bacterium RIFCSPLOWO2_01_FULL_39_10b]
MAIITLKNWYQLDFKSSNVAKVKVILLKIDTVMSTLKKEELIDSWFFLYEGDTIRIRMFSKNREGLQGRLIELSAKKGLETSDKLPFSDYQEGDEMMFNESVVEAFAKIMSEVTLLTISKLKDGISFDNYRVLERLQHCMYNNLLTLSFKSEESFLQQRLLERTRQSFDNDFENKIG